MALVLIVSRVLAFLALNTERIEEHQEAFSSFSPLFPVKVEIRVFSSPLRYLRIYDKMGSKLTRFGKKEKQIYLTVACLWRCNCRFPSRNCSSVIISGNKKSRVESRRIRRNDKEQTYVPQTGSYPISKEPTID